VASSSAADPKNVEDLSGRSADTMSPPVRVDDAQRIILAQIEVLPADELPLLECLDLVLAEDVSAGSNVPPFANSAMDGYAIRSRDTEEARPGAPASLAVVSTIPSGLVSTRTVGWGEAARIMTGAPMPAGADAVVRQEEVKLEPENRLRVSRAVPAGENVRAAGEDITAGTKVMTTGTSLDPVGIGVLASLGRATARVHRRPNVGILSTGDEIVPPGEPLRPGQIRDSNGLMLAALVREAGGTPVQLGIARDELDDVRSRLHRSEPDRLDLVISSGGVSVGDFDLVKQALEAEGDIDCWQVLIKPGKPLAFGRVAGVPFLGLPGNPVASYVGFLEFGRPAIRRQLGHCNPYLPEARARLACDCDGAGGRRHFLRGRLRWDDGWIAEPIVKRGSGVLSSMLEADCLIVIPEECQRPQAGDVLTVQLLRPERAAAVAASGPMRPDGQRRLAE